MSDKPNSSPPGLGAPVAAPAAPGAPVSTPPGGGTVLPRRSPGHRGQDQRDTVAEMIQKAHEISLEAGSKMATVMKDVIFAAAGITPFAAESARDLVNYMVRRGQMGAEEAERINRQIEEAAERRGGGKMAAKPAMKDEPRMSPFARPTATPASSPVIPRPQAPPPLPPSPPAAAKPAAPAVAKKAEPPKKPVEKKAPVAKKPAAKKPATKKK